MRTRRRSTHRIAWSTLNINKVRAASVGLLLLLLGWRGAGAQTLGPSQNITAQDSGTPCVTVPAACATFNVGQSSTAMFYVTGGGTGTLSAEFSSTIGGTFLPLPVTSDAVTQVTASTITTTGAYFYPNFGIGQVRLRATSAITGTYTIIGVRGYAKGSGGPALSGFNSDMYRGDGTFGSSLSATIASGSLTRQFQITNAALAGADILAVYGSNAGNFGGSEVRANLLKIANRFYFSALTGNQGGFLNTQETDEFTVGLTLMTVGNNLTSGWGGSPSLQPHSIDSNWRVTLGTSPNASTLVMTMSQLGGGTTLGPSCMIINQSTGVYLPYTGSNLVVTISGTFAVGNVITGLCWETRGP